MKNKFWLTVVLTCILCLFTQYSWATTETTYDIHLYTDESINLRSYIISNHLNFELNDATVIQNMNASILSVNSSYILKSKDIGTGMLILVNGDNRLTLNVTIESPIQSVTLKSNSITLLLGETQKLEYDFIAKDQTINPDDLRFIWKCDKPHVASISSDNRIITQSVGTAHFTGTTPDGAITVSFDLSVIGHSYTVKITAPESIKDINVGESVQLSARLGTKDVSSSIAWESLSPHILTVDDKGLITAIGEGRGIVRASASIPNKKDLFEITTHSMIDKIELSKTTHKFNTVGETYQMSFNLYPKNKSVPPILSGYRYTSSNEDVASVSQNGLVTAKGPGLALISIIFDDSQKRASCTVEVPNNYETPVANYVAVEKIVITPHPQAICIGKKQLLSFSVLPENATNKNVTFNVSYGANDQIQQIGDDYYFIPNKVGNIQIKIAASNGVNSSITIPVTSPIESLKLSLSTHRQINTNEEQLYIGENAEVLTRVYTTGKYTTDDVYPASLQYAVKDPSIAELYIQNGKYYIRALKKGKTELYVETVHNSHKETLWLNIVNPVDKISTDDLVVLPTETLYRPRISYTTNTTVKNLADDHNLNAVTTLTVDEFYLTETFIDTEINYEQSRVNSGIASSRDRLNTLLDLKKQMVDGYVRLADTTSLKNRYGTNYKFYKIENQKITAYYPSKLNVRICLDNTTSETNTTLIWQDYDDVFSCSKYGNTFTLEALLNQYNLSYVLSNLSEAEQIQLLITYMNHIESFDSTPNVSLLSALAYFEGNSDLEPIMNHFSDNATKGDLALASIYLYKKYIASNPVYSNYDNIYYYDVISSTMKKALSLGYMDSDGNYYFGVNNSVTEKDVYTLINKIISYEAPSYLNNQAINHGNLLVLLHKVTQ